MISSLQHFVKIYRDSKMYLQLYGRLTCVDRKVFEMMLQTRLPLCALHCNIFVGIDTDEEIPWLCRPVFGGDGTSRDKRRHDCGRRDRSLAASEVI